MIGWPAHTMPRQGSKQPVLYSTSQQETHRAGSTIHSCGCLVSETFWRSPPPRNTVPLSVGRSTSRVEKMTIKWGKCEETYPAVSYRFRHRNLVL